MATVKLSRYECSRGLLPPTCLVCGEPSDVRKPHTFSWHHPLAYLGLLAGLLPFVIIALILTKRMRVEVPLCRRHRGHWTNRNLLVLGTLLVVVALGIGAVVYESNQPPGGGGGWLCLASICLLVVWLFVAAIASATAVRPTEITEDSIKLTKVHQDFVDALREERARYREEGGRRRGRYGDERDDYDDLADDDPPPRRRRPRDDQDYDDRDDDRPRRRRDDD